MSLTARGRCLVAAGLVAAVCGLLLSQLDLLRVAVLALALPLLTPLVTRAWTPKVSVRRTPAPPRVTAGEPLRVRLDIVNTSRRPTGTVRMSERVAGARSQPPRFVLEDLPAGGRQAVSYTTHLASRGRHRLGPLELRLVDALGLSSSRLTVAGTGCVAVLPVVEDLDGLGPLGALPSGPGTSDGGSRAVAGTGASGTGTREYRPGDDVRRVHWRSTARHGELMVRLEEQTRTPQAVVLLDVRRDAHHGSGPSSSFEQAVSAVASLAALLLRAGFAVRVTETGGAETGGAGGSGGPDLGGRGTWVRGEQALDAVVDALVDVQPRDGGALTPAATSACTDTAPGSPRLAVAVAVLGRLGRSDVAALAGVVTGGRRGVAVLVEPPADGVTDALLDEGWVVVALGRGQSLAQAWESAGRSGDVGRGARGAA